MKIVLTKSILTITVAPLKCFAYFRVLKCSGWRIESMKSQVLGIGI
jgi:hypothetical protein